MTTPKLSLPEITVGQAGKEITHNEALMVLDALVQATVKDKDLTAPPGSPADGDMYIPATGASGDWVGQAGNLALWRTSVNAWTFITPGAGWEVWVDDEALLYRYSGSGWAEAATAQNAAAADNELLIWQGI